MENRIVLFITKLHNCITLTADIIMLKGNLVKYRMPISES